MIRVTVCMPSIRNLTTRAQWPWVVTIGQKILLGCPPRRKNWTISFRLFWNENKWINKFRVEKKIHLIIDITGLPAQLQILYKYYCTKLIWIDLINLGCFVHSRILNVTITGKRWQILTYARQSPPMNNEDSLAWHTYCYKGYPFIMVISVDLRHSHLLPSVW